MARGVLTTLLCALSLVSAAPTALQASVLDAPEFRVVKSYLVQPVYRKPVDQIAKMADKIADKINTHQAVVAKADVPICGSTNGIANILVMCPSTGCTNSDCPVAIISGTTSDGKPYCCKQDTGVSPSSSPPPSTSTSTTTSSSTGETTSSTSSSSSTGPPTTSTSTTTGKTTTTTSTGTPDGGACFAASTATACRVLDATEPARAYEACYSHATSATGAERVTMSDLTAGDSILTIADGALAATRVIVNQHAGTEIKNTVMTVHTSDGATLSLTPDHALFVDGKLAAAHTATRGSLLINARGETVTVTRVTQSAKAERVVNPVTASGTLLASDRGEPLLAAAHPAWIAEAALMYPSYSLSSLLAYAFPTVVQATYDSIVEPLVAPAAQHLPGLTAALPTSALLALVALADVTVAVALFVFVLMSAAKLIGTGLALVWASRAISSRTTSVKGM